MQIFNFQINHQFLFISKKKFILFYVRGHISRGQIRQIFGYIWSPLVWSLFLNKASANPPTPKLSTWFMYDPYPMAIITYGNHTYQHWCAVHFSQHQVWIVVGPLWANPFLSNWRNASSILKWQSQWLNCQLSQPWKNKWRKTSYLQITIDLHATAINYTKIKTSF